MIEIEGLTKRFGPVTAVSDLSLSVGKGEVLGFLGPNGAGKSTTMKMITGYLAPMAGRISICGHDVETDQIAAQSMLGYLPEGAPAYGDMTARQFLHFIAGVRGFRGDGARAAVAKVVAKTELTPVLDRPIETLSKGFKRRVGLAQAILHDPPVLIMDEPTDGLDPNQKHSVRALLKAMAPHKAIIVSTHLLEEVEAVCTRAVIIDRGAIVADGKPSELLARSRYHNAVTITLAADQATAAAMKLKMLPSVATIEQAPPEDSTIQITAFPKSGALLIEDVSALAARENWKVKELYAEAGRLDEVFRAITTHDTARARASAA
jgi:ABC-2 type transport system ATP-binding protein